MSSIVKCKNGYRVQVYVAGIRESSTFRTKREANAWSYRRESKLRDDARHKNELAERLGIPSKEIHRHEIVANKTQACTFAGIYVLFVDDLVSYVGKSKNVLSRIASHAQNGRKFTHYYAIPCLISDLDRLEEHYIKVLRPVENLAIPNKIVNGFPKSLPMPFIGDHVPHD